MRELLSICYSCAFALAQLSERDIRQIDFANHEFPWREADSWPDHLEWLSITEPNRVRLMNGRWQIPHSSSRTTGNFEPPFAGLTLDEVIYGDLTGDTKDEAVTVLRFDSGGTQYFYWVYVYTTAGNQPKLLAYFRTGDRSAQGLYRVYIRDRSLIVELYDPDKQQGDCCSSGFIRGRYRWDGHVFATRGAIETGTPKSVSRRRVVRRQLLFLVNDNYFSRSTTITP